MNEINKRTSVIEREKWSNDPTLKYSRVEILKTEKFRMFTESLSCNDPIHKYIYACTLMHAHIHTYTQKYKKITRI